jgi:predicted Fe-Mo cluster-binding NifX family protein
MKIAVVTEDGETISQHFGRAAFYLIGTVENGKIIKRELIEKLGHRDFAHEPHDPGKPGEPHGMSDSARDRHTRMAQAIEDCQALLSGGMGRGAYESLSARGIKPVITDIVSIDEALMAYVEGRIVNLFERVH